jgi:tetratricopeptide (TPR) repeat protein
MVAGSGEEKASASTPPTVFVSYASQDVAVAAAVVEALERHAIKCWIAPRDVVPGEFYAGAIVHAIDAAKVIVLVLSENAATSQHVLREVERATSKRHPVVALRIDRAPLPAELEYFLNTSHWLDASGSVERALPKLVDALQRSMAAAAVATPGDTGVTAKPAANLVQRPPLAGPASHRDLHPRWSLKLVAPVVVALLVAAAAAFHYLSRSPKLTDKDTIVLADFTNSTGDPVFDGTLRQGLAIQLEQSPYLSLISDNRIRRALALMSQSASAALTPEIAQEICERTTSAAVLDGSIAMLGSQYVVGLRARSCRTGEVLDEEQVQAPRKEDVLNALTQIARQFRIRVGESLATVQKHNTSLPEATTASLPALKAYSAGVAALAANGDAAAQPFLKRATEIDPNFAVAHALLGIGYNAMGEATLAAESIGKAYELRDRTSDAERFFITNSYEMAAIGNLEKARRTCELWAQAYPRDFHPHSFLAGVIYPTLSQYERALEESKRTVEIDPDFVIGYNILAQTYQSLDRFPEAERTLERASNRKLDLPDFLIARYELAFLLGDRARMDRELTRGREKFTSADLASHLDAFGLAYSGRLHEATQQSQQAVDLARTSGQEERAALFQAAAALREALYGNSSAAKPVATAALALTRGRDVQYGSALALALAGDSSRAQQLADDLEKRFPEDTAVKFNYLPTLRASIALNHGDAVKAVELLQVAAPYDFGSPPSSFYGLFGALYPTYIRGRAKLDAGRGADAAREFQRILDHRGIVVADPIGALAHLQLGRALVLSGDLPGGRAAYRDFLALWRNADPEIPVLKLAKAEYEKLQ